jgi:hypothetical protein
MVDGDIEAYETSATQMITQAALKGQVRGLVSFVFIYVPQPMVAELIAAMADRRYLAINVSPCIEPHSDHRTEYTVTVSEEMDYLLVRPTIRPMIALAEELGCQYKGFQFAHTEAAGKPPGATAH